MPRPELRMSFADNAALARELESNLKHGRAFVTGASGVEVLADCTLVLTHPTTGKELALSGQAVFVSDSGAMQGVGVQLRPFGADVLTTLSTFVHEQSAPSDAQEEAAAPNDTEAPSETQAPSETEEMTVADAELDEADAASEEIPLDESDLEEDPELASELQKEPARHERLRKISASEQQKVARHGELNDRVMLERIYGKGVWAGLLQNPKLTVPEVARIARKGTAPRPLLDLIIDNGAWIQSPVVRRALLGNPRVTGEAIMKLLRITPKHELKIIHKTTTYSTQVRDAARKLLEL